MSGIAGILGLVDTDRSFINTIGQKVVFEAANEYLQMADADMMKAFSIFIEQEVEDYKERYYLPGGGRLDRRGGQAPSSASKAYGSWDVAFPLEDFGKQIADDDVTVAYMTVQQFQRHLDNIRIQDINTMRFEILKAIFNSAQDTFVDPLYGSLAIEPLANNDSVVYPPVLGSETEAVEMHYLESGYLASAISDTNNPYVTIRDEIEEHFGTPQGYGNIAVFINNAQVSKTVDLTDFDEVPDNVVKPGSNTDVPFNFPAVPGRVIGRVSGVWVVEWRWIPANYAVGIDLDAPAPLKMRVDPASTGLPRGLQLIAENAAFPLNSRHYRHRFGIGCGNRLNGVSFEFGNGGTYTVPTAYA